MIEETMRTIREMVTTQIEEADREGLIRYGTERQVTFKQETAYRLCHQDFFGLSTTDAAEVMECSQRDVNYCLQRLREIAPQLFPILTPSMAKMYVLFMEGNTNEEIADCLNVSTRHVRRVLKFLHDHKEQTGMYFRSDAGRRIAYNVCMDGYVKERW
jgi:hypothetical protein